jgi:hypothetical protein
MGVSVNRGEEFRGTDGEGEGEIRDQGYQK